MNDTRERQLINAFVQAANTLVADYDIVEQQQTLIDNAVDIFDVDAAAILLVNDHQELEVLVSTSESSSFLGVLQLRTGEGPCIEAYTDGAVVTAADSAEMHRRWPSFAAAAQLAGFASVHSVPLRTRDAVLGSMNLFRAAEGALNARDADAARALTDVATISVLQQRTTDHAIRVQEQLQRALDSRIVIEQAKGFIAQTHGTDLDTAFGLLRSHARSRQELLADTARAIVDRTLPVPDVANASDPTALR